VVLQGQEIRNCIYEGKFNNLLIDLNKYPAWRDIIGRKGEDKRMRDMELILRFFALFHWISQYKKPMKQFLNNYMKENKNPSEQMLEKFRTEFKSTANAVVTYLGKQPFHLHRGLNAAVYDSVFTAVARRVDSLDAKSATEIKVKRIQSRYKKLVKDDSYLAWVTSATTDDDIVPKRINRAEKFLFD